MTSRLRLIVSTVFVLCFVAALSGAKKDPWILKPVVRPQVPSGVTESKNPIDAFVAAQYKAKGLKPSLSGAVLRVFDDFKCCRIVNERT